MWTIKDAGQAQWRDDLSALSLVVPGGNGGMRVESGGSDSSPWFQFQAVGETSLPTLQESYIRGNSVHLDYPQQSGAYSLGVVFRIIDSVAGKLVLESTISLETTFLDSHPTVDLILAGATCDTIAEHEIGSDFGKKIINAAPTNCPPIWFSQRDTRSVAVLLGPHDYPFTSPQSSDHGCQLRLFGEFLEKGVIRKARPWFVLCDHGQAVDRQELIQIYHQLCDSPLPLTS